MSTTALDSHTQFQAIVGQIRTLAYKYIEDKDFVSAQLAFQKLLELEPKDINARFIYAQLIDDGSHKKRAEARDMMLAILDENPEIFEQATEGNLHLIRSAAVRCSHVGPFTRSMELFRKLAAASNDAADYFSLSEILTQNNEFEEAVAALEKAIKLNPAYDNPLNRETLELARTNAKKDNAAKDAKAGRAKVGRYPETKDFLGDLQTLITKHIAVNLAAAPKFLDKSTRFFTMGSCFARNLSKSLNDSGYNSHHMEISEYINTTFANRVFVDWLRGAKIDPEIRERIVELLPPGSSQENTLAVIKQADVFILTLGVAAAFFDRETGAFVLPRPTALNSRALAEKYKFRTASVQENVDNVRYLIDFVRSIRPGIKVIVTVSPVPLLTSFEYESVVQADCLSKSTMRLVAHEIVNNSNLEDIWYWPSFEVFRWGGSNASSFFAADDGAAWHVSEDKVSATVRAFVQTFSPA
ncbi:MULTISPECIES: GSCFA domain-containing protein [unclassified Bradyrhizobium]|uniref:GSCFA domain-containing protein n=1 Tax=unclassified Bradyrhizobium TaxID=2631580 RepID=UPI0028E7A6A3|nr:MULTISPECIES: GSCFA domain-containing protein [unclassified Bradyrhizobium]